MKFDYNDANRDESYRDYIERKKAEKTSTDLATLLIKFVWACFKVLVIYSPMIYLGFLFTEEFFANLNDYQKLGLGILSSYVLLCILFFIKGLLIGFKQKGNKVWILLWLICVCGTCIVPAIFAHSLFESLMAPTSKNLMFNRFLAWAGAGLIGIYVYSCYKFKSPYAPKPVYWIYSIGYKLAIG